MVKSCVTLAESRFDAIKPVPNRHNSNPSFDWVPRRLNPQELVPNHLHIAVFRFYPETAESA